MSSRVVETARLRGPLLGPTPRSAKRQASNRTNETGGQPGDVHCGDRPGGRLHFGAIRHDHGHSVPGSWPVIEEIRQRGVRVRWCAHAGGNSAATRQDPAPTRSAGGVRASPHQGHHHQGQPQLLPAAGIAQALVDPAAVAVRPTSPWCRGR